MRGQLVSRVSAEPSKLLCKSVTTAPAPQLARETAATESVPDMWRQHLPSRAVCRICPQHGYNGQEMEVMGLQKDTKIYFPNSTSDFPMSV